MNRRAALLPVVSAALVAAVLGTQVANGGGDFVPARAADPCIPRAVAAVSSGLDGLAEQLVLVGLDRAACRLQTSRESLVLRLGVGVPTDAEVDAVRGGLLDAVDRLDREGRLPASSALLNEALARGAVTGLLASGLRALPDGFVDSRVPTPDVLRRTVTDLDVRALLKDLSSPDQIQARVQAAVVRAAIDVFVERLPGPLDRLGGLFD